MAKPIKEMNTNGNRHFIFLLLIIPIWPNPYPIRKITFGIYRKEIGEVKSLATLSKVRMLAKLIITNTAVPI